MNLVMWNNKNKLYNYIMGKYSFFTHPNSVCMSYFEHMKLSLGFASTFFVGSVKAVIHAFFPNTFITSTSDIQKQIGRELSQAGCHREE